MGVCSDYGSMARVICSVTVFQCLSSSFPGPCLHSLKRPKEEMTVGCCSLIQANQRVLGPPLLDRSNLWSTDWWGTLRLSLGQSVGRPRATLSRVELRGHVSPVPESSATRISVKPYFTRLEACLPFCIGLGFSFAALFSPRGTLQKQSFLPLSIQLG